MSNRHSHDPDRDARAEGTTRASDRDDTAADRDADPDAVDLGGERLPAPHTERSPEGVLKVVLDGLRTTDEPHADAGLRTAFNFASPEFRTRVGGSLESFVQTLTDPINRPLVDHEAAHRGRLTVDDDEASEQVVVTGEDGETNTYEFFLRTVADGKYEGCWMVDGVDLVYAGAAPDHRHMPMIEFDGVELKCEEGDTLRDVLLRASGVSPHNDMAQTLNCGGNALCGTCAVEIVDGEVTEPTTREKRRIRLPPLHGADADLRLSCQCEVLSDLAVRKHGGTWGQHIDQYTAGSDRDPGDPIEVSDEEYLGEADLNERTDTTDDVPDDDLELSDRADELLERGADALDGDALDDDALDDDALDDDALDDDDGDGDSNGGGGTL